MAENSLSYSRFSTLPVNIATHGVTAEEIKIQKGKPDKNPAASPMARSHISETRLAFARGGSDLIRLGLPTQPTVNPYAGQQRHLTLTRKLLRKLAGKIIADITSSIEVTVSDDETRSSQMGDSLRRVENMGKLLSKYSEWGEAIYLRTVTASKA